MGQSICVYSSSSRTLDKKYYDFAYELGRKMAQRGDTLVFGGGMHGLMGASARGVKSCGGKMIGVVPEKLNIKGVVSEECDELIVTPEMRSRKRKMEDLSDVFVALPGGFGTFEELFEILTSKQLDYHRKAIVIMNCYGYYDELLKQFERSYADEFVKENSRQLYFVANSIDELFGYLDSYVEYVPESKYESKESVNINERLITALSFLDKTECVADIGSDHGYSSVYMIEHGIAKKVIATDISIPSLEKTVKLVENRCLSDKIECRAGDGLRVLKPDEVNSVFIAGMGAELIADIVEASSNVAQRLDLLVLQPMNSAAPLRERLTNLGYDIFEEGITFDNEKYYQIIKCKYTGKTSELTSLERELGTFVYKKKIPLCKEFIEHKIDHYENIIRYVGENETEAACERIEDAKKIIDQLREALRWANTELQM